MVRAADDPANAPFRRDELTWLAFGMLGFYNYLLSGLDPLMPSLREELGLSYTIASLHFGAFAVGMILAGLVGDRVVRRHGRHGGAIDRSRRADSRWLARRAAAVAGDPALPGDSLWAGRSSRRA